MRRLRPFALVLAVVAMAALGVAPGTKAPRVAATPVATSDALYAVMGRVFPDPHGCRAGLPGSSPWAKGSVCAVQFIQWDEFVAGVQYLEQRFPRYVELINLHDALASDPEFAGTDFQSAGLPSTTMERDRRDLYVVKVTDKQSPIPEAQRKRFAFSLSIHGVERAGLEGGLRAAEDLITWAATAPDTHILEPTDSGPTAREVVENSVSYFIMSNPDGWHRGEVTTGNVAFQRYNGNGMDLNRDFPSVGYTEEAYTPASEPETRGYMAFLRRERSKTADDRFVGAVDLHGMLNARSFSFTLLGGGKKDYRKNAIAVATAISTFHDSEERLIWSPLVATGDACPGPISDQQGGNIPMCTDQWGTVWDTIDYQVTGDFGSWMESPELGLDAVGIDNEMALSHLAPNSVFVPDIEQLHVDGNKGLVFSNIAALLFEQPVEFHPGGRVAYVPNPVRVQNPGGGPAAASALLGLPAQVAIAAQEIAGQGFEFDVAGPDQGVFNGTLAVEATFTNVAGVGGGVLEDEGEQFAFVLERFGPTHAGDAENTWVEVARYFNQSGLYAQAGARIDLASPLPGQYRVRPSTRVGITNFDITFGPAGSSPVPEQLAYDVANTDFFDELNQYAPAAERLQAVTTADILDLPRVLDTVDTLVLADIAAPGVAPERLGDWVARLRAFVEGGGNLVLTDGGMQLLEAMGIVPAGSVQRGVFYAGWINFADGEGATYDRHPLAKGVNKPGTAEGSATLDDVSYENRHQTYEPVPTGYFVSTSGAGNASCSSAKCDAPNWVVAPDAWKAAGGTAAGTTFARLSEAPGSDGTAGVSLGELALGAGRIRVIGALLPQPTEKNPHHFGLAAYGVTYTGYELIGNALQWQRAGAAPAPAPAPGDGRRLPATGGAPLAALGVVVLLAGLAARRSRYDARHPRA